MTAFEVSRPAGQCSVSGRPLTEGEAFYSVLIETAEGFERRDIAEDCWTGPPEDSFCHFKTRLPKKTERRKVFVDDAVLLDFFRRLGETDEPGKLRFRFVLALILMRKRLLKYESTVRNAAGEYWRMRLVKDKQVHDVLNPEMDDTQIQELTSQLGVVLAGHASDLADAEDAPDDLEAADAPAAERVAEDAGAADAAKATPEASQG